MVEPRATHGTGPGGAPSRELVLRRATVDGAVADIRIVDGVIDEIGTDLALPASAQLVDLSGFVVVPSAVETHTHLDKAFLAEVVPNPTGDLIGAIEAMGKHRSFLSVDETLERATRAARMMLANGYTSIRTHADVTVGNGLTSIEALVAARAELADEVDVQIVALAGQPLAGPAGADQRAMLREAMAMGADLVGGCPHLEPDGTLAATDVLVDIAADAGVGLDLHTDETLDPGALGLLDLVHAVHAGFAHPVTASHCVSLGMLDEAHQQRIAEAVAEAGIGVVTNPHTNLYLQGRSQPQATPRGLTAVAPLRAAGVPVAAGQDNLQDPFNPLGRGDPLDVAGLMILTAHLLVDDAYETVSASARRVLGHPDVTVAAGCRADLLAVRGSNLREAIASAPPAHDRVVIKGGALIG